MSKGINGLTLYIRLFQWCGFTSGYIHPRYRSISHRLIIETCPIIIAVAISFTELWFAYTYRDITFHPTTTIGYLTDVIQVIGPILSILTIVIENVLYGRHIDKILWEIMNQIDYRKIIIKKFFAGIDDNPNNYSERRFHWKFILINGIGICTDTTILIIIRKQEPQWSRCIIFCLWSSTIARLAILQAIFYLEWTVHRFDTIEKYIIQTAMYNNDAFRQRIILKQIRLMYSDLWSLTCRINYRFDLTMFSLILNYFICITISLYWVIIRIAFGKDNIVRKYFSYIFE